MPFLLLLLFLLQRLPKKHSMMRIANGTEKDIASAIIEDVSKCSDKAATGQDETGRKDEWMKFLYSVAKAEVLFS